MCMDYNIPAVDFNLAAAAIATAGGHLPPALPSRRTGCSPPPPLAGRLVAVATPSRQAGKPPRARRAGHSRPWQVGKSLHVGRAGRRLWQVGRPLRALGRSGHRG